MNDQSKISLSNILKNMVIKKKEKKKKKQKRKKFPESQVVKFLCKHNKLVPKYK